MFPEPFTPEDCDLRDFGFMPLDVARLRRSKAWLIAKRKPDLGFYMLNLWMASWHEKPAASLEDDDDVLADLAMCNDMDHWLEIKDEAMRGWVRCADGRLYHEFVATKALEAWLEKLAQRISSGAGNAKRWGTHFDADALRMQMEQARAMLASLDPMSNALSRKRTSVPVHGNPAGMPQDAGGTGSGSQGKLSEGKVSEGIKYIGGKPPITPGASDEARLGEGSGQDLGAHAHGVAGESDVATGPVHKCGNGPLIPDPAPPAADVASPPAPRAPRAKAPAQAPVIELPEWMPLPHWQDFVAMRLAMGKSIPFTEAAARGIVRKVTELRKEGHDPAAVLEQSTRNSWRDVFAVKQPQGVRQSPPSRPTSPAGRYAAAGAAIYDDEPRGEVIDAVAR